MHNVLKHECSNSTEICSADSLSCQWVIILTIVFKAAQSDVFIPFQLGVSSHECATPVKLVHNAVGHLNGSARTIGAAVIGYLGECRIQNLAQYSFSNKLALFLSVHVFIAAILFHVGVRAFVTKPVATNLQYIGGAAAILGLVAMASDVEGLYAAVKALVCVVKSNPLASKEMERIKGYQVGCNNNYQWTLNWGCPLFSTAVAVGCYEPMRWQIKW